MEHQGSGAHKRQCKFKRLNSKMLINFNLGPRILYIEGCHS